MTNSLMDLITFSLSTEECRYSMRIPISFQAWNEVAFPCLIAYTAATVRDLISSGSCRRHVVIGSLPGEWWFLVILGLCAGIISGTLGVGSGILLIPALVLLFGFEQKAAQGTSLAVMVPMAFVGAIRYWRNPHIELNAAVIALIALGAVGGALVGTELAARLSAGILRKIFALILMIVAIRMFTASPRPGSPRPAIDDKMLPVDHRGINDATTQR